MFDFTSLKHTIAECCSFCNKHNIIKKLLPSANRNVSYFITAYTKANYNFLMVILPLLIELVYLSLVVQRDSVKSGPVSNLIKVASFSVFSYLYCQINFFLCSVKQCDPKISSFFAKNTFYEQ